MGTSSTRYAALLVALLAGVWVTPSSAQDGAREEAQPVPREEAAPDVATIEYTVRFEGELEPELATQLEKASNLIALRDKPPRTIASLARRISRDEERLNDLLRSQGFYNGKIQGEIDQSTSPATVVLNIETGTVYLLEQFEIRYTPANQTAPAGFPREPEDVGLSLGMPAVAAEIRRATRDVITQLGQVGHPLATITDESIVVDHDQTTMRVVLDVDAGPQSLFGPLELTGLETVSDAYVRSLVTWTEGARFDQRDVDAYRTRLADTGLFDSIAIDNADRVDADGKLPVEVTVVERKHRSIGAGASISTDEGLAVNVFWEHRNLLGENEQFRISARAGLIEQSLTADLIKPNYAIFGQNLLLNGMIRRQEDDAFDEQLISVFAGLERRVLDNWRVRAGPSFEYSIVTDNEGEREFELIGFPMSATRDDTDDLLDASRGTRLSLSLTPYFGAIEESVHFLTSEVRGEAFLAVDTEKRIILAARSRIGSIVGEETETLPANKRFFSGGGGSVRGYEFRSLGPLDDENDPLGGRSVFEIGFETRLRVSENIGLVPFIEGGTVYDDPVPDGFGDLQWAVGLGGRYFTAIGPLRVDIAFPLDRRSDIDDAFEVYLSIGQAF